MNSSGFGTYHGVFVYDCILYVHVCTRVYVWVVTLSYSHSPCSRLAQRTGNIQHTAAFHISEYY